MPDRTDARVAVVDSHPIQYHVPWLRGLHERCDLTVFYAHRPSERDQAEAGYGVPFEWDVDLESGYRSELLTNVSSRPNVFEFAGCDTPELGARLLRGRYDAVIVTGWYLKTYWQAILACRRSGIPVLVRGDSHLGTPRASLKRLAKELVYPRLLRRFDAFLCVGERNRQYLVHYGVEPERIFPAPHFVDNAFFAERAHQAAGQRAELRASLGAGPDDTLVLFVGRLVALKRAGDLVAALARLKHQPRSYCVAFVGKGELEDQLRRSATDAGVRACFAGFRNQSELPAIYAAADVLALPSEHETWGLVVNEAMACGTPAVVSSTVGCAPDMIAPGSTGEVFTMGDARELAEALSQVAERGRGAHVQAALLAKLEAYSCERAVEGTLDGIAYAIRRAR